MWMLTDLFISTDSFFTVFLNLFLTHADFRLFSALIKINKKIRKRMKKNIYKNKREETFIYKYPIWKRIEAYYMSLFQSTLSLSQNKIKVWTLCFVVNCVVMFLTSPLQLITTTIASDLKCWTNNSFKIWRAFLVLQYLPNTGFDRRCQHRNQFNLNTQFSSFYRILPLTIIFSPFSTFPSFLTLSSLFDYCC